MGDDMHQPRDDNGQFVSLKTLFERERVEHSKDHDREQIVAKEAAQRLEREVEKAAARIDSAVQTALIAVAETARVHAEAHGKEHVAHERIHTVEKEQVAKAEASMNKRLESMNEFRAALTDQANRAVPREYYDARHEDLRERVAEGDKVLEQKLVALEKKAASAEAVDAYKRIVSGTLIAALIAIGIAVFNLITNIAH